MGRRCFAATAHGRSFTLSNTDPKDRCELQFECVEDNPRRNPRHRSATHAATHGESWTPTAGRQSAASHAATHGASGARGTHAATHGTKLDTHGETRACGDPRRTTCIIEHGSARIGVSCNFSGVERGKNGQKVATELKKFWIPFWIPFFQNHPNSTKTESA